MTDQPIHRPGRLLILTGDGKGKSSSAFGMVMRAAGWEMPTCVIQFIKGIRRTGEQRAAERLGVAWHALGDGFTWDTNNPEKDKETSENIWEFSRETILSDNYRLVVLDEILYAIGYGWISAEDVAAFLTEEKPIRTHVILTGRGAPQALLDVADTVTSMTPVKHPFEEGIPAAKGIEL
ncbi:MAG: cob(I)yrinic acid a,c-diamide adenosyltransferase [Magnetococcales bacterium]|nr:cob(I)yrinic acid a,c-diamide adenosyltransferase [Magnetococcales bacterium]